MNCEQRLELARQLHASGSYDNETIEVLFPELKEESGDERIRKSIIAILKNYVDDSNTFKPKILLVEMSGVEFIM